MNYIPAEKYNLSGEEITEGISLITAVKNREETLRQALPTWLTNREIDEIIIVDWSSDHSLETLVNEFQDGRIKLAIVEDQPKWILSYAYNLAARFTSRSQILKMDADVKMKTGFFDQHRLHPGHFYTGNWRIAKNENETHLNGIAFYFRNDFFKVNGFNEFITTYGWDDTDLFDRLEEIGLLRLDINPETLYHIPHEERVTHQTGTNFLKKIEDKERATINILMNRYIFSNLRKWDQDCKMTDFQIERVNAHKMCCRQTSESEMKIPADLIEKSEFIAIRERLEQAKIIINQDLFDLLNKNDLIAIYRLYLLSRTDPTLEPDARKVLIRLLQPIQQIKSLTGTEITSLTEKISVLSSEMVQKEESIKQLKRQLQSAQNKLNLIQNSKFYRYGSRIARIISKFSPSGLAKK